jgi:hypothetical protein
MNKEEMVEQEQQIAKLNLLDEIKMIKKGGQR